MTTETDQLPLGAGTATTPEQTAALQALRARYRETHDLFSSRELAHLSFMRWLVETGRLFP